MPIDATIRKIREISVRFRGGRDSEVDAPYSLWVFRGGVFRADEWSLPNAWEKLAEKSWHSPVAPRESWFSRPGLIGRISANAIQYISQQTDTEDNSFITNTPRPMGTTGTLTLAIYAPYAAGDLKADRIECRVYTADPITSGPLSCEDIDGDGYRDGPPVWVDMGELGLWLYDGEDTNGDGLYEPAGEDGVLGTADDEYDATNPTSHPLGPQLLATDLNRNRIPDGYEELAHELGEEANYWFGDNADDVASGILADAIGKYGDPASDPATARLFAYSAMTNIDLPRQVGWVLRKVNGKKVLVSAAEAAKITCAELAKVPGGLWKITAKPLFNEVVVPLFADYVSGGERPVRGEPNLEDHLKYYSATYVNGIMNNDDDCGRVAQRLADSYQIPVTPMWNPTHGLNWDAFECVKLTGFNVLLLLSPTQLEQCGRHLYNKWCSLLVGHKDNHVIHFAHSEGAITTAPELWRFHVLHPDIWATQLHVVVFGSGFAYLDYLVLPPDTHFVYTERDPVGTIFGGRDWNPCRWFHPGQQSEIANCPNNLMEAHKFQEGEGLANTYDWWAYNVGGPVFQKDNPSRTFNNQVHQHSIDGEKAWLQDNGLSWWYDSLQPWDDAGTVQCQYGSGARDEEQLKWLRITERGSTPTDCVDSRVCNPRQDLGN
ncbi:MAG: hypothetical protein NTW86_10865 [Candidatus Sumerlaeota bacterium]|nr:hypothetical protein [Candidatus Sumerlaeota bacterium]